MNSVPYDLIGEKVNLRLTPNTVEVFFRGNRVTIHPRSKVYLRDPVMKS
ncbi:Mu transposase domain-containing protein, partial [Dysosmobacter welbionis]